jgi:hypothetical protein
MRIERQGATFRTVGASRRTLALLFVVLASILVALEWTSPTTLGSSLTVLVISLSGYLAGYRKRHRP